METIELFLYNFWCMFVDMAFYIMLGLFFVGVFHAFIKKEKVLKHLGTDDFSSVVKSSVVGVPLPLCSCGVVPTAIELKKSGASHGSVISFLISTPQTGVDSILATYSMMGWVMAIFRPFAAFISGIVGGTIVNIFGKNEVMQLDTEVSCGCCSGESSVEVEVVEESSCGCCSSESSAEVVEESSCGCGCSSESSVEVVEESSCGCGCCSSESSVEVVEESSCGCCSSENSASEEGSKIKQIFTYAYGGFLDELAVHFLIGMFLATCITTFLPADFFVELGLNKGVLSMIAMMFIGLPMYICSTSSIPIAMSLMTKGLSFGGAFVFLFTGPVTNMMSLVLLGKVLGKKITALYVGSVMVCAIIFGLILDFLIDNFGLNLYSFSNIMSGHGHSHGHENEITFPIIIAFIFALLLVKSLVVNFKNKTK